MVAIVFALPLLGAWLAHVLDWAPGSAGNYGELLEPRPLPDMALGGGAGSSATLGGLRGRWVLVTVDASACGPACERKLYLVRQVRKALGQDAGRIERVWIATDAAPPDRALLEAIAGSHLARFESRLAAALRDGDPTAFIYLVDPRGNLMMRFPRDADASRMLKDLRQLLRYTAPAAARRIRAVDMVKFASSPRTDDGPCPSRLLLPS